MGQESIFIAYYNLANYKWGENAFILLHKIYTHVSGWEKITKKLCWELLGSKSKWNKSHDMLMKINAIHLDNGKYVMINSTPDYTSLDEVTDDDIWTKELAWVVYKTFGWDYRSTLSYARSIHKKVNSNAEKLWYSLEDYIISMGKLIKWDAFWWRVISWQTFMRKYDKLTELFTPAKNVKNFSDVANIF